MTIGEFIASRDPGPDGIYETGLPPERMPIVAVPAEGIGTVESYIALKTSGEEQEYCMVPLSSLLEVIEGDMVEASVLLGVIAQFPLVAPQDREAIVRAAAIIDTLMAMQYSRADYRATWHEHAAALGQDMTALADQWSALAVVTLGFGGEQARDPRAPREKFEAALTEIAWMTEKAGLPDAPIRRQVLDQMVEHILNLEIEERMAATERVARALDLPLRDVASRVERAHIVRMGLHRHGTDGTEETGSEGSDSEKTGGAEIPGEPIDGAEPRG